MDPILLFAGTRPEAIKLAPLYWELKRRELPVLLCTSGQHGSLLSGALAAFSIHPERSLPLLPPERSLGELTGKLLEGMTSILLEMHPGVVIVQGDTATAYAGALAGFYQGIPVGHVEAGLRTGNLHSPFPEEYHRRAIALLAELHFAPTKAAEEQLILEGYAKDRVYRTGNTVVDALRYTLSQADPEGELEVPPGMRLLLFTAHRRESQGAPLAQMLRALRRLVETYPDLYAVCPLHPNPVIQESAAHILNGCDRIRMIEPPDTIRFHHLLAGSYLVMTDSGGIQEEAVSLGIPTVVMRETTERQEGLDVGVLCLAGSEETEIFERTHRLLAPDSEEYRNMRHPSSVFGNGHAAKRIADILQTRYV